MACGGLDGQGPVRLGSTLGKVDNLESTKDKWQLRLTISQSADRVPLLGL